MCEYLRVRSSRELYEFYVDKFDKLKPSKLGKRIGSGHISLPEQKDSATFFQPRVNVTKMQNDTPQLLGQHAAYDTNNSPIKKQDPRIKSSPDNRIRGFYDEQTKLAIPLADSLSRIKARGVPLHKWSQQQIKPILEGKKKR